MRSIKDEINYRVVMLAIQMGKSGVRLTERAFRAAIRKLMEFDDRIHEVEGDGIKHGKQTMKELMDENAGVSNIEITKDNIGSFERVSGRLRFNHVFFSSYIDNLAKKTSNDFLLLVFFGISAYCFFYLSFSALRSDFKSFAASGFFKIRMTASISDDCPTPPGAAPFLSSVFPL